MKSWFRSVVPLLLSCLFMLSVPSQALSATVEVFATASGWVLPNGDTNGRDPLTSNYIVGGPDSRGMFYRNFFVFDLTGVADEVQSATLRLMNPVNGFYSRDSASETYTVRSLPTDPSNLLPDNWPLYLPLWQMISTGTTLGNVTVTNASNGTIVDIVFNQAGIDLLNTSLGGYVAFGGLLSSNADLAYPRQLFANSGGGLYRALVMDTAPAPVPLPPSLFLLLGGLVPFALMRKQATRTKGDAH